MQELQRPPTPLGLGECWIWIKSKVHTTDEKADIYVGLIRSTKLNLAFPNPTLPSFERLKMSPFARIENNAPIDATRWHTIGDPKQSYELTFEDCAVDKKQSKPGKIILTSSQGDIITLSTDPNDGLILRPLLGLPA